MFAREQLGDPLGERGKAVVIPPIKIPSFDNVIKMQGDNNALMLQAAKYHQEQQQKEAALQLQRDKMAQVAAQKAEAEKARRQANLWSLMPDEKEPLIGDAQDWSRRQLEELQKQIADAGNAGVDINSGSPEALKLRQAKQEYISRYRIEAQNAKAYLELKKTYDSDPTKWEQWSAEHHQGEYNKYVQGGFKEVAPISNLLPRVGVATPAEVAAYEKAMLGEAVSRNSQGKKPIGYNADGDAIYQETESYGARPFEMTVEDVNKNLKHSTDPNQKKIYNFYYNQAKAQGLVDDNTDEILPQYFQKREEVTRDKGGIKDVTVQIQKDKSDSDGGNNFGWNGGMLVMGRKGKTASLAPANTQIDAGGQFTSGWNGFIPPTADFSNFPVVGTLSVPNENVIALNQLPENVAFEFSGGVAKPIKSKSFGNGGVKQDQLLVLPSLGDVPLNKTQLEEAKRKGLPVVYKSYKKTVAEVKDENDNKLEKEVLLDVSAISKADFNNMKVASEYDQQTIDELNQRNSTKTPAQQVQIPVAQPQGKVETKPKRDGKFSGLKVPGLN